MPFVGPAAGPVIDPVEPLPIVPVPGLVGLLDGLDGGILPVLPVVFPEVEEPLDPTGSQLALAVVPPALLAEAEPLLCIPEPPPAPLGPLMLGGQFTEALEGAEAPDAPDAPGDVMPEPDEVPPAVPGTPVPEVLSDPTELPEPIVLDVTPEVPVEDV